MCNRAGHRLELSGIAGEAMPGDAGVVIVLRSLAPNLTLVLRKL